MAGTTVTARPTGKPCIYKAELTAIALAATYAKVGATIVTDSKGSTVSICSTKPRVIQAKLVHGIRNLLISKNILLQWTKGHAGNEGNDAADSAARAAHTLPPNIPEMPRNPWEVVANGSLQQRPHKTWTKDLIPKHALTNIHSISWRPLNYVASTRLLVWHFGLVWAPNYAAYTDFWYQRNAKPCDCGVTHPRAAQSYAAQCISHPLHLAILSAWQSHAPLVTIWHNTAAATDKMILAKLLIPCSLMDLLITILGRRAAFRAIKEYQHKALKAVEAALWTENPPMSTRRNVRDMAAW